MQLYALQTDFRGMGVLGLSQLVTFASTAATQTAARAVLAESQQRHNWFSFAITGEFSVFSVLIIRLFVFLSVLIRVSRVATAAQLVLL
jgi:hypothetical protein